MALASVYPCTLTLARAERLEQRAWERYARRREAFNRAQRRLHLAQGPYHWHGIPREKWPQLPDNRPALFALEKEAWETWLRCLRLYRAVVANRPHNAVPQFDHERCAVYGHCFCVDYGTPTWEMCCGCSTTRYTALERGEPWDDAPPTCEMVIAGGHRVLVDASDYRWLSRFKWHLCHDYVTRTSLRPEDPRYRVGMGRRPTRAIYLHKFVVGVGPEAEVDHKNLDHMDNRSSNLRPCTRTQNQQNARGHLRNTTGYKGVTPHKGRYEARIAVNGKLLYLGSSRNPVEAAAMYNAAALEHFGEFARLNQLPPESETA